MIQKEKRVRKLEKDRAERAEKGYARKGGEDGNAGLGREGGGFTEGVEEVSREWDVTGERVV